MWSRIVAPEEAILETERLLLRKLRASDAEPLAAVLCDPVAMRFFPAPKTRQQVDEWIKQCQERYLEWGFGRWAMIAKASGQVVGNCGLILYPVAGNLEVELGYHVVPQCQGQGFATEAARACLAWAFENTSYERVISFMAIENLASRRVAERIHARFLGDCPGAWDRPFCYFGTTRNEFAHRIPCPTMQSADIRGAIAVQIFDPRKQLRMGPPIEEGNGVAVGDRSLDQMPPEEDGATKD